MIPIKVEGVRRNFTLSSAFLYSIFLVDATGRRLIVFGVERHEALPIVAALNNLALPRQETLNLMAATLQLLNHKLEKIYIESHSMLPPAYNLCSCILHWHNGETIQEQATKLRPGDAVGLALLMDAPLFLADELYQQIGVELAEGQTPELVFARHLLKREGISLSEGQELRLGYSKTPARNALVKEFKASLSGKAPLFPEEDTERLKQEYLAFLLGTDIS